MTRVLIIAAVIILATRFPGVHVRPSRSYLANVSAYCPCEKCCGVWALIDDDVRTTADGTPIAVALRDGCIAAPRTIAYGTRIAVPGYRGGKPIAVHDRGGAIRGDKLDLLFPTHKEALRWGRRFVRVDVYEE